MERTPLDTKIDKSLLNVLNYIMDEAIGTIIQLSSAPTTAGGELKTGQVAIFGDDLYINIEGTTRKYTGTAV